MKIIKHVIMAGAILAFLPSMAQKLEYRDFKATNEMTARLKDTEVIDENSGKRAALIKIYTPFPDNMLGFDAGLFKILGRKQAGPGEVWLYVPERTQKVTVNHPNYSPIVIWFEGTEAESGKTYTVELNVEGRNVALIASTPGAEISVDGEPQGKSPVNMHMPLGSHLVRAELGSLLFEDVVTLTPEGATQFTLRMEDENLKFGDVDIEVTDGAELWFQDRLEGIGSLRKHLKEGSYVVTAKLQDHDDSSTAFTVEAGKTNTITATPPVPHLGYLEITTEPTHGVTVMEGDVKVDVASRLQLPVARYEYTFAKKGYYPQTLKFRIEQGKTLRDTVRLEKIQYVKKHTGYAAVSFAASGQPSVGFTLGGYYENVNLEVSYNLGIMRSKDVSWYRQADLIYEGDYSYRLDEMAVRAGYQLRFAERFGLTPQVGFVMQRLSAQRKEYPGNGLSQTCVSVGARFAYYPIRHIGIFVTPEYAVPVGTKEDIVEVYKQGGLTRGGIKGSIGISVSL